MQLLQEQDSVGRIEFCRLKLIAADSVFLKKNCGLMKLKLIKLTLKLLECPLLALTEERNLYKKRQYRLNDVFLSKFDWA